MLIERGGEGKAFFGVLEVDSPDPSRFDDADADFLAGFAGLLGNAPVTLSPSASLWSKSTPHEVHASVTDVLSTILLNDGAFIEAGAATETIRQFVRALCPNTEPLYPPNSEEMSKERLERRI